MTKEEEEAWNKEFAADEAALAAMFFLALKERLPGSGYVTLTSITSAWVLGRASRRASIS